PGLRGDPLARHTRGQGNGRESVGERGRGLGERRRGCRSCAGVRNPVPLAARARALPGRVRRAPGAGRGAVSELFGIPLDTLLAVLAVGLGIAFGILLVLAL